MTQWQEIDAPELPGAGPQRRAVAYYRHSAKVQQEHLIEIQRDQVQEWARTHGFEIIREFVDASRSTVPSEERPTFTELIEQWVKQRDDFEFILCVDATRWTRFPGDDFSARSLAECERHGKRIIFTTTASPSEGARK